MIRIEGGCVIDPATNQEGLADVLISGSEIQDLAKPGSFRQVTEAQVIDATDLWVIPGLIDVHVHLREPGFEWKETIQSGSQAAVRGGYTTICCMANTRPVNDNAEITRFILERAKLAFEGKTGGYRGARVHPIGAVSIGLLGKEMAPFSELRAAGCVAFSDDGEPVYDAGLMRRALEWCGMLGVPICCHEEDKNITCGGCMNESALSIRLGLRGMPKVGEDVMVARDIELARITKGKVHFCHVSTARSVELIRRAKQDGIDVSAEVTPHHLVLTEDQVRQYDTNSKMSPPLREAEDVEQLRKGIRDGTLDMIASDHAPHERDTKQVEFDRASFGILGLQTSLPLMIELVEQGVVGRKRAIELLSTGPAERFGFSDRGRIAKGYRADITLVDPKKRWTFGSDTIRSLSKNTPFLNRELVGLAHTVLIDGRVVLREGELITV